MSSDVVKDAAEGAAKGLLSFSAEQIKELARKLKDKKLAFIEDPKTIEVVKEQYLSGEGKFYQIYIKDKELLFLVRLGLTLRKVENDTEKLQNLRDKIFGKYKVNGLHIAEFVQNGILSRYIGISIEELQSIKNLEKEIKEVLRNIEKHVLFIKNNIKQSKIISKAIILINAHSPPIFIVSGTKSAAEEIKKCIGKLGEISKDYKLERLSTNDKETIFFKRVLPN